MHILLGTIVGAVFAAATVAGVALIRRKPIVWKQVALAALGGAIAGAVTSATLGAGGTAAAGLGREVVAFAVGGASGGTAERLAENAVEGRAIQDGLLESATVGAVFGVATLGAAKGFRALGARILPKSWLSTGPPKTWIGRLYAAKTTGTGSSWLRNVRTAGGGRAFDRLFGGDQDDRVAARQERREKRAAERQRGQEDALRELGVRERELQARDRELGLTLFPGSPSSGQAEPAPTAPRIHRDGLTSALGSIR